jgi:hypothetical protein
VIDESAEKYDVSTGADRHPDVGQRARAREAWIDMDDRGALLFAFITQRKPTGCASAIEEPSIRMQSALAEILLRRS